MSQVYAECPSILESPMPAGPVKMAVCIGARMSVKRSVNSSTVSDSP